MKKKLRTKLWNKYDCRCAYCGKVINYQDMQIDHKFPKAKSHYLQSDAMMLGTGSEGLKDINDIENLMPSCRRCNYHKGTFTVEEYREQLILKIDRVKDSNVLLLEQYGIITFNRKPVVFYFEKLRGQNE